MKRLPRSFLALLLGATMAQPSVVLAASQDPEALKQQQMEYAKQQFGEGEALFQQGDFIGAMKKYETAYQYAPDFHVLNYNIALAAVEAGDCMKAKTSFQRFLDLVADHPMRGEAQTKLMELERSGCAAAPPPVPGTPPPEEEVPDLSARPVGGEQPGVETGDPTTGDGLDEPTGEVKKYQFNGLMKGGIGLMAGGGVLTLGGLASFFIGFAAANKLSDQGNDQSPTGFTNADFSDSATFNLEKRRKGAGWAAAIMAPLGGALLVTGFAIYMVGLKKCKAGDTGATASRRRIRLTGLGPSVTRTGGGLGASFAFGSGVADLPRSSTRCR